MLYKTRGIVLRTVKYGDGKLIVDFYTEQHGRVSCIIKVSKSQKGKLRKQLFLPLTILHLELDIKPNQQLHKIVDAQLASPWTTLNMDPAKMAVGMFLCEILCHVTTGGQSDLPLYRYIEASMEWLDATDGNVANFHIAFLVCLTYYLGIMPTSNEGNIFDLRAGEFVNTMPPHHDVLTPEDAASLSQLLRISYPTMRLFKMTRQQRQHCLNMILAYYRLHVPSFPTIKSLAVMEDIFGPL